MKDITRNFSVFVDGRGFIGEAKKVSPPKLAMKVEEFIGGGMSTPIEVHFGTEKLEMSVTWNTTRSASFDAFGIRPGVKIPLTFHRALADADGANTKRVTIHVRGFLKELDEGDTENQKASEQKDLFAIDYYRRLENGIEKLEIDAMLGIIKTNGVSQTAWIKDALML